MKIESEKQYIGISRTLEEIKKFAFKISSSFNYIKIFREPVSFLTFDKNFFKKRNVIKLKPFDCYRGILYDIHSKCYYYFMFDLYDYETYDIIKNFNELADMV